MPQLQGRIYHIGKTEQVTDNFSKREFILTTDVTTQYPQYITLGCNNAKTSLLDDFKEGDMVIVEININGKLSNKDDKKAFNNLVAYQIKKAQ